MPRFTAQTARKAAIAGNLARWHSPKPKTPPTPAIPAILPRSESAIAETPNSYALSRLQRVRAQLDRLDALMDEETDPARFRQLADASARLDAQEANLSGRPKSGTMKPSSGKGNGGGWPIHEQQPTQALPEPQPQVQPVPQPAVSLDDMILPEPPG